MDKPTRAWFPCRRRFLITDPVDERPINQVGNIEKREDGSLYIFTYDHCLHILANNPSDTQRTTVLNDKTVIYIYMHARTHTRILAHAIFFCLPGLRTYIHIYTLIDRDRPINNIFLLLLTALFAKAASFFPRQSYIRRHWKQTTLKRIKVFRDFPEGQTGSICLPSVCPWRAHSSGWVDNCYQVCSRSFISPSDWLLKRKTVKKEWLVAIAYHPPQHCVGKIIKDIAVCSYATKSLVGKSRNKGRHRPIISSCILSPFPCAYLSCAFSSSSSAG